MSGITKSGELAESLVKQLTGYAEPEIEDKLIGLESTTAKSINQIRPLKSSVPLVLYHAFQDQFYVIPPIKVFEMAEGKKGQHSSNSFECFNLGLSHKLDPYKCTKEELKIKIEQSFLSIEQELSLNKIKEQYYSAKKLLDQQLTNNIREWRQGINQDINEVKNDNE